MNVIRRRILVLVTAAVVAATVAAGLAFARSTPASIGTGVVVIETNLALNGSAAAGTGIVLTRDGQVLTNNHVIRGATSIRVRVPGTGRSYSARVVGYDVTDDVALIRATGAGNLKTLPLDTSTAAVGQAVTALGNAGGTGTITSARGHITGLSRSITVGDDQGGSERLTGLIETDAALEPGDSGGPLLRAGKVIGMDTAASVGSGYAYYAAQANDGYAIPIAKAIRIVKQIAAGKASATVHVGATGFLGVQVDFSDGYAVVEYVVPGGPADRAGLDSGDAITTVDGRSIASTGALTTLIGSKKPGQTVKVGYVDQYGTGRTATVTLGSGPPQ
jgi:S1-C subfamily serine protease